MAWRYLRGALLNALELAAFEQDGEELALGEFLEIGLPDMDYARKIVGLRIKPLYDVPA